MYDQKSYVADVVVYQKPIFMWSVSVPLVKAYEQLDMMHCVMQRCNC